MAENESSGDRVLWIFIKAGIALVGATAFGLDFYFRKWWRTWAWHPTPLQAFLVGLAIFLFLFLSFVFSSSKKDPSARRNDIQEPPLLGD